MNHLIFENGSHVKDSSYADDVFILVNSEHESMLNIKTILDDFGKLSGLIINVEKTQILPIHVWLGLKCTHQRGETGKASLHIYQLT